MDVVVRQMILTTPELAINMCPLPKNRLFIFQFYPDWPINQVKADSSVLIGRHDDSILGLGFQGASAYPSRRNAPSNDGGIDIAGRAGSVQKLEDRSEKQYVDESKGSCTGVVRTTCNELEGTGLEFDSDKRPTDQRGSHGSVGGVAEIHNSDTEASEEDTKEEEEEGEQEEEEGKEEEAGFGLVVLSASMNGVIRAWETLGKSEKYCMQHSGGVEVTSMLVLPGGSVLVTGMIRTRWLV